jgi:hypothetical protein
MPKFPSQFSRSIHVNTSSQVKVTVVESIPLVIFSLSLTQNAQSTFPHERGLLWSSLKQT